MSNAGGVASCSPAGRSRLVVAARVPGRVPRWRIRAWPGGEENATAPRRRVAWQEQACTGLPLGAGWVGGLALACARARSRMSPLASARARPGGRVTCCSAFLLGRRWAGGLDDAPRCRSGGDSNRPARLRCRSLPRAAARARISTPLVAARARISTPLAPVRARACGPRAGDRAGWCQDRIEAEAVAAGPGGQTRVNSIEPRGDRVGLWPAAPVDRSRAFSLWPIRTERAGFEPAVPLKRSTTV